MTRQHHTDDDDPTRGLAEANLRRAYAPVPEQPLTADLARLLEAIRARDRA